MRRSAVLIGLLLLVGANAEARHAETVGANACADGSYSVVNSPDGSSLSILFDNFSVTPGPDTQRRFCSIQAPLNLPQGYSLGVYRVDYRGFAHLSAKQTSELSVDYALGPHNNSRSYHRKIRGAYDGEFVFTENIGAGLMKRIGCGDAAVLNVTATLELQPGAQPAEATVALDSVDGAPKGGLIYHFNLKKCGQ